MGSRKRKKDRGQRGAQAPLPVPAPLNDMVPEFEQPLMAAPAQPAGRPVQPATVRAQFVAYSGPLPHPDILRQFNEIVPGLANRIVTQFEEQGRHRRKLENRVVWHNIFAATTGQVMAFIVLAGIGAGGLLLAYYDKRLEGVAAVIAAIGGAAWVLREARGQRQQNLDEKRDKEKRTLQGR
jgi:uncharacterized membrane protein